MDHAAPIWVALDPLERGEFVAGSRDAQLRAKVYGINARVGRPRRSRNRVLVASWGDTPQCGPRHWIMVEHGSGQCYSSPHVDAQPEWEHSCGLDAILVPNAEVGRRNEIYHPHAVTAVVGSARVERLAALRESRVATHDLPTVAFTHHWNAPGPTKAAMWAWPIWRDAVDAIAARGDSERGYRMLATSHPRAWKHLKHWYRRCGIEATPDFDEVIKRADVLVFDSTSAGFEAMACGVPVVMLDAPWYEGVTGEPRFGIGLDAGLRVGSGSADELHAAIVETLGSDPCKDRRAEVAALVYGEVAGSLERSLAAIRALP